LETTLIFSLSFPFWGISYKWIIQYNVFHTYWYFIFCVWIKFHYIDAHNILLTYASSICSYA
jgi:hypothetical protein